MRETQLCFVNQTSVRSIHGSTVGTRPLRQPECFMTAFGQPSSREEYNQSDVLFLFFAG